MYALNKAGCFEGMNLTKRERYVYLPALSKLGWIEGNKVRGYRKVTQGCINICTDLQEKDLKTLHHFKAFLLASCEAAILSYKRKLASNKKIDGKKTWKSDFLEDVNLVEKKKDGRVTGRVFKNELSDMLPLGYATLTRWRNLSKKLGYNKYSLKRIKISSSMPTKYRNVVEGRYERGSFYVSSFGNLITLDRTVSTKIPIIFIKDFSGMRKMKILNPNMIPPLNLKKDNKMYF